MYQRAMELPPDSRSEFLAKECHGDASLVIEVETLIELVRSARNIRSEMSIGPKVELELYVYEGPARAVASAHAALICRMARLAKVDCEGAPPPGCATAVAAGTEVCIPIAEHVDLTAEAERLKKEVARIDKELARLEKKLANPAFLERAPAEVVEQDRGRCEASARERETLQSSLERVAAIAAGGSS